MGDGEDLRWQLKNVRDYKAKKNLKTQKKTYGKLSWYWIWQRFLRTPKAQTTKEKGKLDFIKIKKLFYEGHYQKVKWKPLELENVSANHDNEKGLIPTIYKEILYCHNNKKLKTGKGLEWTFLQRIYTNSPCTHEKMLNITSHKEMEIKLNEGSH